MALIFGFNFKTKYKPGTCKLGSKENEVSFGTEEDCKRLSKYTDSLMYCFFLRNIASVASINKGWRLIGRKGLKEGGGEERVRNTCYTGSLSLRKQLFLLALRH